MRIMHPILLTCLAATALCAPARSAGHGTDGVLVPADALRTWAPDASPSLVRGDVFRPVPALQPAPPDYVSASWVAPAGVRRRWRGQGLHDGAFRGEPTFTLELRRRRVAAEPREAGGDDAGREDARDATAGDNEFRFTVEAPGLDPDDLRVGLTGNVLTITGEKKVERDERDGDFTKHEG